MPGARVVRTLGALAALACLLLGSAPPAQAHAVLVRTNPGDGATVQQAPHELTLSFSEHVDLRATIIEIVDGDGNQVPVTDLRLAAEDGADIEEPAAIVAALPDLAKNSYRVSWETLSSDDLHRTSGIFVFGVGRAVSATDFVEPVPRVEESALRWLLLLGIAFVLGAALVGSRLPAEDAFERARSRLRRVAWLGGVGALLTSFVLLVDQIAPADGITPARLLLSSYGGRWAYREIGLVLLALSALLCLRGVLRRLQRPALAVGILLTTTGTALLGHSGTSVHGQGLTRILATATHIAAVTTWTGGVLCLTVVLAPGLYPGRTPVLPLRSALRRFAVPAAGLLSVAVVTGVYLSGSVVGSVDALLATTYGRTLIVKVTLVGLMMLLALANHRRLRGPHDLELPRRGVRVEALLGLAALAATGVLASGQPATESQFVRAPSATRGPLASEVADLQEAVSLRPNHPGPNVAVVDVFDSRRPSPGPVMGIDVAVGGADPVPTTSLGEGHWTADLPDLAAGPTTLTVIVRRDGLPDLVNRQPWTVAAAPSGHRTLVSTAPVGSLLRLLACLLALGLALAWTTFAWVRLRAQRRRVDALSPATQHIVRPGPQSAAPAASAGKHRDDVHPAGAGSGRKP